MTVNRYSPYYDHDEEKVSMSIDPEGSWVHINSAEVKIPGKYEELGQEIGQLVDKKNTSYGNSFAMSEDFFKLLFPNGIPVSQYRNVLLIARIFDKIVRISADADSFNEDAFLDIAGYGILGSSNNGKKE